IKGIPYGISDYELIRTENYYYVDKTPYLETLKKAGRYLFLIRPRRFGKSLFVSLLEAYYDVIHKDRFDEFFSGTWIHQNADNERNKYLILTFNFSVVEPDPDKTEASFLDHVRIKSLFFLDKYSAFLEKDDDYFRKKVEESRSASDILAIITEICRNSHQKFYVIIDEYDNFANTILSTTGEKTYFDLTHGTGFFRTFFNVLKSGTSGTGAPVTRSLITGVSPITMDDVTSGYNIGKNISMEPSLNRMLGFTEKDIVDMIEYYRAKGRVYHSTPELMEIMTQWYGNYLFSKKDDVTMFNSDMILYFFDLYMSGKELPEELMDRNVRIDYGKLRHLIVLDKDKLKKPVVNGNFGKLKQIIETGGISSKIVKGFPLEQIADAKNFISLLFYLGLLTVKGPEKDKLRLIIPNETIRRLYHD
ncbi:MAG: AAA family ATPase, partial [bacterium]|nr:AAA family ATPase [bacterium]